MKKGEQIQFLDYTIKNCLNNDGLVLLKESHTKRFPSESHLGNYGDGEKEDNVDNAKKAALLYYMIARPETFHHSIMQKVMRGAGSGSFHEYFLLESQLIKEGLQMPEEITCGNGMNCMIYFKNKPLSWV